MPDAVLCIYTLPPRLEARQRGFVDAWGEERAYCFWESLHRDLLQENGTTPDWDLVVMTSGAEAAAALERLAPEGVRVEQAPERAGGLAGVFAALAPRYGRILLTAGDLPGLTRERVAALFDALDGGAEVAFFRERKNRFSAIGMAPYRERLLDFDYGAGRFWHYLNWLEEKGVRVFWQEERLDDLPGPEWVVPVLGFAARRLLPSMEEWPVPLPPQPELVLLGRAPATGTVNAPLAGELAGLPGVTTPERARSLAVSLYRAILFDRMDSHRGLPDYRCVGAFPLDECSQGEMIGFPEILHPLPEVGSVEGWLRDVLCDLDPEVHRLVCASDVPFLDDDLIGRAFQALRGTEVVLVPSGDGDYNLVGMSAFHEIFGPDCFESGCALERVQAQLRARHVSICTFSETLRDLSTLADLRHFQAHLTIEEAPRLWRQLRWSGAELGAG